MIHKLAAIKLLRELEMKINGLSTTFSGNPSDSNTEALKKKIIAISCQHGKIKMEIIFIET